MELEFSQQIFEKYTNIKFHENPARGSRVVPCKRTDERTDRQTDITKLTVAFRTFATEPKSFRSRLPKWSATPNNVSTHALITQQYLMKNSFPTDAALAR
jgi:hypothetical protein